MVTNMQKRFNKEKEDSQNENVLLGRNPILEALKAGRGFEKILVAKGSKEGSILKIIALAKEKKIPVVDADRSSLDKLSSINTHQGVAAYIYDKDYCDIPDILEIAQKRNEKPFIIIAENITDPYNLGAIIRSAEGVGAHGVIIPKRNSAILTPIVYKASAGAVSHMSISKVTNIHTTIDALKKSGVWVFGAAEEGENMFLSRQFDSPLCIVIGSEGEGLSRLTKEKCDFLISIPMKGKIDSLNASVAAGVIMYEVLKQRG